MMDRVSKDRQEIRTDRKAKTNRTTKTQNQETYK